MPDRPELTPRQRQVLETIQQAYGRAGFGPTIREIADAMGISSPNGVVSHLRALAAKGYIHRTAHRSRAIQLADQANGHAHGIPLAGLVAAGLPAEVNEQHERLELDGWFHSRPGVWALRVSGDSMIEAHIADGDFVIVEAQSSARPGQIVVVRTGEGEATLKYWHPEKNRVRLQPANSAMKPIYSRSATVLAVVIGLVRLFRPRG